MSTTVTKTFAFAIAALIGTAGIAMADTSYFAFEGTQDNDQRVELHAVVAETDAQVEIYNAYTGELLGVTDVHAGANPDVYVHLTARPYDDLRAVLTSNGQVLAETGISIDRS
jgi:hypothetical protein